MFAQFKSASGVISQLFQTSVEYQSSPNPSSTPSPASSPTPTPIPDPVGRPTFNTSSISLDRSRDVVVIRGSNFGNQTGFVYYSRGSSTEAIANVINWRDDSVTISRTINDPESPVPNRIVGGQYLRVCKFDQNFCSPYVVMPNF